MYYWRKSELTQCDTNTFSSLADRLGAFGLFWRFHYEI